MTDSPKMPFAKLRFDKSGSLHPRPAELVSAETTDVIVLAHGWKNNEEDADELYGAVLANVQLAAGGDLEDSRRLAAVGLYWPSLRFHDDLTLLSPDTPFPEGGAAGLDGDDLDRDELATYAAEILNDLGASNPKRLSALATDAASGGGLADTFVDALRELLSARIDGAAEEEHRELLEARGRDLHGALKFGGNFNAAIAGNGGDGAGKGATFEPICQRLERLRSGGAAAVARILNQATYTKSL